LGEYSSPAALLVNLVVIDLAENRLLLLLLLRCRRRYRTVYTVRRSV